MGKLQCSTEERETTFRSSDWERFEISKLREIGTLS